MADPVEFLFSFRSLPVDVRAANRVGCRRHDGSKQTRTVAIFIRRPDEIFFFSPMANASHQLDDSHIRLAFDRERKRSSCVAVVHMGDLKFREVING